VNATVSRNEIDSRDWENQVLFRDCLIQHPELAEEYSELKKELAEPYLDGKAPFIKRVLEMTKSGV